MEKAPIIQLIKFNNMALSITIHAELKEEEDQLANAHSDDNEYYEISWLPKETGKPYEDLSEYSLVEYILNFIGPRKVHLLLLSDDAEGFIITFSNSSVDLGTYAFDVTHQLSLLQLFSDLQVLCIQNKFVSDDTQIMIMKIKEFEHDYFFKVQLLKQYCKIFLIYMSRHFEERQHNAQPTCDGTTATKCSSYTFIFSTSSLFTNENGAR
jgi:hypothetical protein